MLEASVEMSFFFQTHNPLEMRVVDVRVHTEQTLQDCLHDIMEVAREWVSCSKETTPQHGLDHSKRRISTEMKAEYSPSF